MLQISQYRGNEKLTQNRDAGGAVSQGSGDDRGRLYVRSIPSDQVAKSSVAVGAVGNRIQTASSGTPLTVLPAWVAGASSSLLGLTLNITVAGTAVTVTFSASNCASQSALLAALNALTSAGTPGFGTASFPTPFTVNNSGAIVGNFGTQTATVGNGTANSVLGLVGPNGSITAASTPINGTSILQLATDIAPDFSPFYEQVTRNGLAVDPVPVCRELYSASGGTVIAANPSQVVYARETASAGVWGALPTKTITIPAGSPWNEEIAILLPGGSVTDLVVRF